MADWRSFRKVNELLNAAERLAGDEFQRQFFTAIKSVNHDEATIVIKDRGNGFDVSSVSFRFDLQPDEIARMLTDVVRI